MKQKYLLGMLLGGAMLTACSVEDDFKSVQIPQEENPSAPVFTVSFDNGTNVMTRATWKSDGQKVSFDDNDVLSLYHGVEGTSETWPTTFQGYQNAIYQGRENPESDKFEYYTKAAVLEGGAVLVYPADTTYAWVTWAKAGGPVIEIAQDQNAKTKLNTPYMSEILTIGEYDKTKGDDVAGYNKHYDIVLKRVGSTLDLTLDLVPNKDIEGLNLSRPIGVTKVTLKDADENDVFTTKIKVKASEKAAVARVEGEGDEKPGAHLSWNNQSELDIENVVAEGQVASISTTDLNKNADGKDVATFTLLPMVNSAELENGEVEVYTNYGYVTLTDPDEVKDENKIWSRQTAANTYEKTGISEGLAYVLNNEKCLWKPTTMKTSVFYNEANPNESENVGFYLPRTLVVDMADINMNGLHITDEAHLIDVAEVLKVIGLKDQKEKNIFYLDGTDGKFTISTKAGYDAYEYIATYDAENDLEEGTTLEMVLCNVEDEECEVVVLDNAAQVGGAVPAILKFGKQDTEKINVELAGEGWILEGSKTFVNVDSLVVTAKAELELKGTVNVKNPEYVSKEKTPSVAQFVATTALVNRPEGTIKVVDSQVTLQMNTRNYGEITIGTETTAGTTSVMLNMSGKDVDGIDGTSADKQITLVNDIYATEVDYQKDKEGRGNIYLWNSLATMEGTNARIYNFGYIEIKKNSNGKQGSVLLYANATSSDNNGAKESDAVFNKPFKNEVWGTDAISGLHIGDNIFGVVKVAADDNPLTSIKTDAKGFVKIENATLGEYKKNSYLINYTQAKPETTSIPEKCTKYVELTGSNVITMTDDKTTSITGLIVPKEVVISVQVGAGLKVSAEKTDKTKIGGSYLMGYVYKAGTWETDSYVTYFGGEEGDETTHVSTTNTAN